jgi:uncharacterized membrane protein YphA (DoxX/SURF4 family)
MWGTSVYLGNIFLIATVGKIQNFTNMSAFFSDSGYVLSFLYFIMTAETLGGIGILMHYKLRTGTWAALGLMLIMIGAAVTHWRNHDPFSDAYAPVVMLITLFLLQMNYYFENKLRV